MKNWLYCIYSDTISGMFYAQFGVGFIGHRIGSRETPHEVIHEQTKQTTRICRLPRRGRQ